MLKTLDADKIIATVDKLALRIGERFPEAGLRRLAEEFGQVARQMRGDAVELGRPNWRLRVITSVILVAGIALFASVVTELRFKPPEPDVSRLVQIIEPAANIAILVALGIGFIVSLESRWKRKRALASLHSLRSMIHVIDMHQLTKDPAAVLGKGPSTASSPARTMSEFELLRYLDYCSEMLSLTGKLAALYGERTQDPQIINSAGDIEALTTNLGRKIWQKIMILSGGTLTLSE